MKRPILWTSGLLSACVLAATAYLGRSFILELWHLRQLRTASDIEEKKRSAEVLGELGSVRAVRPLLELEFGPRLATIPMEDPSVNLTSSIALIVRAEDLDATGSLDSPWIAAVRAIGPRALPALCEAYKDASGEVRERIARRIRSLRFTPENAGSLLEILADDELEPLWRDAIYGMIALQGEKQRLEPSLVELTRSPHGAVRRHAIAGLRAIAETPNSHLEELIELVGDADVRVRTEAAFSLGHYAVRQPQAIKALRWLEDDVNEEASRTASWALHRIAMTGKP